MWVEKQPNSLTLTTTMVPLLTVTRHPSIILDDSSLGKLQFVEETYYMTLLDYQDPEKFFNPTS